MVKIRFETRFEISGISDFVAMVNSEDPYHHEETITV